MASYARKLIMQMHLVHIKHGLDKSKIGFTSDSVTVIAVLIEVSGEYVKEIILFLYYHCDSKHLNWKNDNTNTNVQSPCICIWLSGYTQTNADSKSNIMHPSLCGDWWNSRTGRATPISIR